jgi:hypothetical protein
MQRSEDVDADLDILQPNIKFSILKEQSLFYSDIPDDDPICYHELKVGQGNPEELADAIGGLGTSAGKAGNVKPLVIKLCEGADSVRMSARMYAPT